MPLLQVPDASVAAVAADGDTVAAATAQQSVASHCTVEEQPLDGEVVAVETSSTSSSQRRTNGVL